jgi:tetratricopeptide (TPR) repeat protein
MRKLPVLLICLLFGSVISLNAQVSRLQERDAEWKSYSLPQTHFTRQVTPDKDLVFRVPADWKQEGAALLFNGPNKSTISIATQTLPEGYPLTDYVARMLKGIGDWMGSTESILTRRTQFQDLEAREIHFDMPDTEGTVFRSITWITISGPLAVSVNVMAPVEHAPAVEPFFKATVQSVMFVPANFAEFESTRLEAMSTTATGPIHEVANIAATLNEPNSDREAAINRLTPLFVSQSNVAVDLLLDRRAVVRSAAAEALARSKNPALKYFLWHLLDDPDPFVAEAAARRLGQENDVVPQLLHRSWTKDATQKFARVWPFMSKEKRVKFFQGLFSQTRPDRDAQMGALTLLGTLTPAEYKLPLARIRAAKNDSLTTVALRVANDRGEALPVVQLMKLAASQEDKVKRLAVESLGQSALVADIPQLEALLAKTPTPAANAKDEESTARKALHEEIKLSIKKIRLRNDLGLAKDAAQRREIIRKTSTDAALADFALRFDCELSDAGCSTAPRSLPPDFKIKSFAENLFPQKISHYTAIANPAQTVQRFYESLHGMQLDSPRAQANLILVIGALRQKLGQELGAPFDAPALIDYTGIKSDSPIVFGAWTAAGAPDSVSSAQRRAIVLRVKDRERFERVVESYQQTTGTLVYLTDYLAAGARVAAALPAILPFSAQAILSDGPDKPEKTPAVHYSFVGQTEWNGIPIKSIQHRWIGFGGDVSEASTYLTFVGDVAILASDVATIRDLLSNATTAEQQLLAGNEEFRRTIAADGDIVYFSDLKAVLATPEVTTLEETKKANESGALKFSNSSWENFHRMDFDESEWSKPLLPFHPKELSAPRDLLPASTLAYYLMKVDVTAAWQTWPKTMNPLPEGFDIDASLWSLDFKQEVLPELGPECGAVWLEMTGLKDIDSGTWAAFCKLKTNKLSEAFSAGKLFRNVGPTTDTAEIKSGETSYFVAIKNGFLAVSNHRKGLSALGGKTNLASTRDYSRSAEKVPAGIVAFGGYNLEAAIAAAGAQANDGLRAQIAGMALSVASAFHSQSFFATASPGAIEGRSSVAMDREGRYAVADFSYLPRGANITFATLEPHGMPIIDQKRLSHIVFKVRAKAPGPIDNIRDDINSPTQKVEQKSPNELVVTVAARRIGEVKKIQLPVTNPEVATFLKSTGEITSDDRNVIEQARQIAGDDRDAWSVARKLADWTHKNLEWKSVARAGAAETLATREADCSEFSQLYVSMARSLGLPARIVSGLAYGGNSFGGHAWVEVWIGEWVELDPTWGTDFVDATHIRNEASALVTAAALNLIDVEVLETRRTVAEFQKSPKVLAEHFVKALSVANASEVEATLDLATLTDEFMGTGAWNGLNEQERAQISSAYRRLLREIVESYGEEAAENNVHLLNLEEKGDRAEALCYVSSDDLLIRLRLVRRSDVWYLLDVIQVDPGLHIAAEKFSPVIKSIEANRGGKKTPPGGVSDFVKIWNLVDSDPAKAVAEADRVLQTKATDQTYRFLKMIALWEADKEDESMKLLTELSNEQPAFAPAVYRLAGVLSESKPEEAIELYKRYSTLEPYDLRGYRDLADVYETTKQTELAEAAYRKAIAVDPFEIPGYEDLAIFLVRNNRVGEVGAVLAEADKYATENDDVLLAVLSDLEDEIKLEDAERLAATEAHRLKNNVWATLALSDIYLREERYPETLDLIKRAAQIDPKLSHPHIAMAIAYLRQSRLNEALKAIDHALTLSENSSSAHYIRASVLARLGRKREAMTALEKSVELSDEMLLWIPEDEDFKSLRTLPAFKKLLLEAEKKKQETNPN